jgi:hypothetical protein
MQVEIQIRELRGEPKDMAEFQKVLEEAPDYFERVMGSPPGPAEAQSNYTLPLRQAFRRLPGRARKWIRQIVSLVAST